LAKNEALRKKYGQAGKNTAENLFDRKQIVARFMEKLAGSTELDKNDKSA
jgi:hypothetical protein